MSYRIQSVFQCTTLFIIFIPWNNLSSTLHSILHVYKLVSICFDRPNQPVTHIFGILFSHVPGKLIWMLEKDVKKASYTEQFEHITISITTLHI